MVFDRTGEARLLMEKHAPASHRAGGKRYIVYLDKEDKDGRFHFTGVEDGGTETISGWAEAAKFWAIE